MHFLSKKVRIIAEKYKKAIDKPIEIWYNIITSAAEVFFVCFVRHADMHCGTAIEGGTHNRDTVKSIIIGGAVTYG